VNGLNCYAYARHIMVYDLLSIVPFIFYSLLDVHTMPIANKVSPFRAETEISVICQYKHDPIEQQYMYVRS
jgi:hypothetical protein